MAKNVEIWSDKHLREWRAGRKINTSTAAYYLGISTKTLWNWENGAYPRDLRERMIAAEAKRIGQTEVAKPVRYAGRPKSPERLWQDKFDQILMWLAERGQAHMVIYNKAKAEWYESERQRCLALEAAKQKHRDDIRAWYAEHPYKELPPLGAPSPDPYGDEPNDSDFPFIPFVGPQPDLAAIRAEGLERFGVYLLLDEGVRPGEPVLRETRIDEGRYKGKRIMMFAPYIDWSRSTEPKPYEGA